ncbi:LPXTG cell wall anchor domain-containing protein [Pseudoscardovia radai]|uniref:LPXTG cell wall anchor domain-containing protein n=1 Tax=Pseudoscardovia radai TaxID=987066 RepID=UPI00399192E4
MPRTDAPHGTARLISARSAGAHAAPRRRAFRLALPCAFLLALSLAFSILQGNAAVLGLPGYWFNPTTDGTKRYGYHEVALSVVSYADGYPAYCIELNKTFDKTAGWTPAPVPDPKYYVAARMINDHVADRSDEVQAAVSYALHKHIDIGVTPGQLELMTRAGLEGGDMATVKTLADHFWNDASAKANTGLATEYRYTDRSAEGVVRVEARNANGEYLSGIDFTITTTGPIRLAQTSGTTVNGVLEIPWTAQGTGDASYTVSYRQPTLYHSRNPEAQDTIQFRGDGQVSLDAVQLRVVESFQPTVTSSVPDTRVERGALPLDTIVSGMDADGVWPAGATVVADGSLYGPFVSKQEADTPQMWTDASLKGVASHEFAEPGESHTLGAAEVTPAGGIASFDELPTGWYRWVWRISKDRQSPAVREAMISDFTDTQDVEETGEVVHAMDVTLESTASAKTAQPGEALWDDVTLGVRDINGDGRVTTMDWLHDSSWGGDGADAVAHQIPVTIAGGLYMVPGVAPAQGGALPEGAVRVASGRIVTTREGTVRSDGRVSADEAARGVVSDELWAEEGYELDDLPAGSYWWHWQVLNAEQEAASRATGHALADDYPFEHDVSMAHAEPAESTEILRMQPTVTTSVPDAYGTDTSGVYGGGFETDGLYDGDHRSAYPVDSSNMPWLGSAVVEHVEKGRPLLDQVVVGLDSTVPHNTWYHAAGSDEPVTVRLTGRLYGPLDKETARAIVSGAAGKGATADAGETDAGATEATADIAAGLPIARIAQLDVNKPGAYIVDGTASGDGEVSDTVESADGTDLANPASGWYLWRWTISNAEQTVLSEQTGHPLRTVSTDPRRPAYPFLHDVDDGLGSAEENIVVPVTPSLTSLVAPRPAEDVADRESVVRVTDEATGLLAIRTGAVIEDTIDVAPSSPGDLWLTWTRESTATGIDAAEKPISVTLTGDLYRIDEERWHELAAEPLASVPDWAGDPVATRVIDGVDHFGQYTSEPVSIGRDGVYVWFWQVTPDLETADHLTDEAWHQWTHMRIGHAFGLPSESFVVRDEVTGAGCSVRTEASADVADGRPIHDTAIVTCEEGAPADAIPQSVDFPLYRQAAGADASRDTLVRTLSAKSIDQAAFPIHDGRVSRTTSVTVASDETVVDASGTYYFAERAFVNGRQEYLGPQRCASETVVVGELPRTGSSTGAAVGFGAAAAAGGLALVIAVRRRRRETMIR